MKTLRFLCFFTFLLMTFQVFAQKNSGFKNERRIYLWDVTLSMKGFNGAPNIYNKVVDDLINDINNIQDSNTELIVLPFQEKILETWKFKSDEQGKQQLISKIKGYENKSVTRTNIVTPLRDIMKQYISSDRRNVVFLFTDGEHNMKSPSKDELYKLIRDWCEFAQAHDVFAFYVMLTDAAKDSKLEQLIKEACNFETAYGTGQEFILLRPKQRKLSYNIKNDNGKKVSMKIESNSTKGIPVGVKFHVHCAPNDYVSIDQTLEVDENGVLLFDVKQKMAYEQMKNSLPKNTNEVVSLFIDIETPQTPNQRITLTEHNVNFNLINKPEKVLKVYVK